jgi:hypothetical protein
MSKYLFLITTVCLASLAKASTQNTPPDLNPGHGPTAEIDNKRPMIQKKEKAPTSRVLTGIVTDDSGKPISGALVTLTNTRTNEHREFFTKQDGRYRFEDLSFTIDYKVQASYQGRQSQVKRMSQYDRTPNMVRMLEIPSSSPASSTISAAAPSTSQAKK